MSPSKIVPFSKSKPLDTKRLMTLSSDAVAHYWRTLELQSSRRQKGVADRGSRAAVTGGKQMDGFCALVQYVLKQAGIKDVSIYFQQSLELPGYFRPSKKWDMLVVQDGTLLAALEFKSQRGPSFGNNFNNRVEEAVGTAHDLWTAYREGAFGEAHPKPWTGWLMLLEESPGSKSPVKLAEPHFDVFPEFKGASYAKRYELLARRLVREKLYDSTCVLLATAEDGPKGRFKEAAHDLSIRNFVAALYGHVVGFQARG